MDDDLRVGYPDAIGRLCAAGLSRTTTAGLTKIAVSRVVDRRLEGVIFATDEEARRIQEMQEVLGEGPTVHALRTGGPIFRQSVAAAAVDPNWPSFSREAISLDIASVCAVPVQIGVVILGILTATGNGDVDLTAEVISEMLIVTDGIAQILLGAGPDGYGHCGGTPESHHLVVHQATGMTSVQLGVTLEEALLALRAASFSAASSLTEISRQVVRRERRFTDGGSIVIPSSPVDPNSEGDDDG